MWNEEPVRRRGADGGVGSGGEEGRLVRVLLVEGVVGIPEQRRSVVELVVQ
jgi:hypothetical protein